MTAAPVSVIIPTAHRSSRLSKTLDRVFGCDPPPAEVLVYMDGDDADTVDLLQSRDEPIRSITSERALGPGGGRNTLLRAARENIIASFDDDSYPMDADFFGVLTDLFENYPSAGVISAQIIHDNEVPPVRTSTVRMSADFVGCGCVYRCKAFLDTNGYVPLKLAYGMEEADLALQLLDKGWDILSCENLRVRHETDRSHQSKAPINAAHLQNTALLAFLRYPVLAWPYGALQTVNRLIWSIRNNRYSGLLSAVLGLPSYLWLYRTYRNPVKLETLKQLKRYKAGHSEFSEQNDLDPQRMEDASNQRRGHE